MTGTPDCRVESDYQHFFLFAALAGSVYFEGKLLQKDVSENICLFYQGYTEDNLFLL